MVLASFISCGLNCSEICSLSGKERLPHDVLRLKVAFIDSLCKQSEIHSFGKTLLELCSVHLGAVAGGLYICQRWFFPSINCQSWKLQRRNLPVSAKQTQFFHFALSHDFYWERWQMPWWSCFGIQGSVLFCDCWSVLTLAFWKKTQCNVDAKIEAWRATALKEIAKVAFAFLTVIRIEEENVRLRNELENLSEKM